MSDKSKQESGYIVLGGVVVAIVLGIGWGIASLLGGTS